MLLVDHLLPALAAVLRASKAVERHVVKVLRREGRLLLGSGSGVRAAPGSLCRTEQKTVSDLSLLFEEDSSRLRPTCFHPLSSGLGIWVGSSPGWYSYSETS